MSAGSRTRGCDPDRRDALPAARKRCPLRSAEPGSSGPRAGRDRASSADGASPDLPAPLIRSRRPADSWGVDGPGPSAPRRGLDRDKPEPCGHSAARGGWPGDSLQSAQPRSSRPRPGGDRQALRRPADCTTGANARGAATALLDRSCGEDRGGDRRRSKPIVAGRVFVAAHGWRRSIRPDREVGSSKLTIDVCEPFSFSPFA
jgi:hypothetical protein